MHYLKNTHNHKKEPCEILQKKIPKKNLPKKIQKKISKKNWRKATKIFTLLNRGGAYTDTMVITLLYTCTGTEIGI